VLFTVPSRLFLLMLCWHSQRASTKQSLSIDLGLLKLPFQSIMAEDDHGNLEPPPRTSIDDPGARELGKIAIKVVYSIHTEVNPF
jgi:hypothetical protein